MLCSIIIIMKGKAKFKLNGGNPVLLCSKCSKIIKYSHDFTDSERLAAKGEIKMKAQICAECEEKMMDNEW